MGMGGGCGDVVLDSMGGGQVGRESAGVIESEVVKV
jgi:hypothetical protein